MISRKNCSNPVLSNVMCHLTFITNHVPMCEIINNNDNTLYFKFVYIYCRSKRNKIMRNDNDSFMGCL